MSRFFGLYSSKDFIEADDGKFYPSWKRFEQTKSLNLNFDDEEIYFKENDDFLLLILGFISNWSECSKKTQTKSGDKLEIISDLYRKKGDNFKNYLLGNFSICFLDKRIDQLFVMKDHWGTRPLYYIKHSNFFAFSSDFEALIKSGLLPFNLDKTVMHDYLCLRYRNNIDTFAKEIKRAKPSQCYTITKGSVNESTYEYKSNEIRTESRDPLSIFSEKLETALKRHSNKNRKMGLMLSGGIDSSTIALGLKKIGITNIETFSGNYTHLNKLKRNLTDELQYQKIISQKIGFEHNPVSLENVSPLEAIENHILTFQQPFHMPNLFLFDRIAKRAKERDVKIMLDGQDGDNIISHGLEKFWEKIKTLKFFSLIKEIQSYSSFHNISQLNLTKFIFRNSLIKIGLSRISRKNSSLLKDELFFSRNFFLKQKISAFDSHKEKLKNPLYVISFEQRFLFFRSFDMQIRSPFFDKQFVEYCTSLPTDLKLRNGVSRYILRLYLKDKISKKVYARKSKANLMNGIIANLSKNDLKKVKKEALNVHPYLAGDIKIDFLEEILNKEIDRLSEDEVMSLFSFFILNKWLKLYEGWFESPKY